MTRTSDVTETPVETGRARFERYRRSISLISRALAIAPTRFRIAIWRAIEGWHGIVGIGLRYCLMRSLCASCGDNVMVGPYVEIRGWQNLRVGRNVSIHRGCYLDAEGGITIGNDVSIAHATSILSFEHSWEDPAVPIKYNPVRLAPVSVEDDVWIGCGCRLLAGITIGSRGIVAAGAVVTKSVSPATVVGGVPARAIRSLEERPVQRGSATP